MNTFHRRGFYSLVVAGFTFFYLSSGAGAQEQARPSIPYGNTCCVTVRCAGQPDVIKKGCADTQAAACGAAFDAAVADMNCTTGTPFIAHQSNTCTGYPRIMPCNYPIGVCRYDYCNCRVQITAYLCNGQSFRIDGEGANFCQAYNQARNNAYEAAHCLYQSRILRMCYRILPAPVCLGR